MRKTIVFIAVALILIWSVGLAFGYLLKLAALLTTPQEQQTVHTPDSQKRQREIAQAAEAQRKRSMEDYKFKLERFKQDRQLRKNY